MSTIVPEKDILEKNIDTDESDSSDEESVDNENYEEKEDEDGEEDEDIDEEEDEKEDNDDIDDIDEVDIDMLEPNDDDNNVEEILNSDDEDDTDMQFQKLQDYIVSSDLEKAHPEIQSINYEEIAALSRVVRNEKNIIIDPLHTTVPFVTKYEKARIIGTRAEQLESGALPCVEVEPHIINARTIALMEFEEKKIPFIIARPLPNRAIEYWKLQDLECI